jgi:hypothetical protein
MRINRSIISNQTESVPVTRTLTINGTTYDLTANRTWTVSGGGVTGSGTTNYLSKWTSSSALGNSLVYDNGTNVLVNTTTDQGQKFQVNGDALVSGLLTISGSTVLPATTAANLRIASGFSSPVIGRMYIGDGTGWKFHMSKRLSSTTTDLITFFDNGSIQTTEPTGYTAKPWKLGDVFSGTITPDRHIMVEIDGNIYTIPALLGTP